MTRDEARARRKGRGEVLGAVWAIAILPNLLVAFGFNPDGWAWLALRITLSAAFLIALCVWLVALVRERRTPAV